MADRRNNKGVVKMNKSKKRVKCEGCRLLQPVDKFTINTKVKSRVEYSNRCNDCKDASGKGKNFCEDRKMGSYEVGFLLGV